jgi:hypothetical protein
VKDAPKALTEILQAATDDELADVLVTLPEHDLKGFAKLLAAVIGETRPKAVRSTAFAPNSEFTWEAADIDAVVGRVPRLPEERLGGRLLPEGRKGVANDRAAPHVEDGPPDTGSFES